MERIQCALAAVRRQRQDLQQRPVVQSTAGCADATAQPNSRRPVSFRLMRDARVWFGIAFTAIVIAMLAWLFGLKDQVRTINAAADSAAKETRSAFFAIKSQNDKLVRLQARVNLLDGSIARLDHKLMGMQEQLNVIYTSIDSTKMSTKETPPEVLAAHDAPVAETEKENKPAPAPDTKPELTATGGSPGEKKSVATEERVHASVDASNAVPDEGAAEIASAEQASMEARGDRPWVINLASFSDKRDADRFAKRAQSRNVDVDQNQVTIKGRSYWRVQVTGFPSAAEAKAYADSVEAKLGLKDTWLTRR